jgi:hypothetical protein
MDAGKLWEIYNQKALVNLFYPDDCTTTYNNIHRLGLALLLALISIPQINPDTDE